MMDGGVYLWTLVFHYWYGTIWFFDYLLIVICPRFPLVFILIQFLIYLWKDTYLVFAFYVQLRKGNAYESQPDLGSEWHLQRIVVCIGNIDHPMAIVL